MLWRSGIDDGTSQFWREINCMKVETLMSETQGEKAHIVYKEEDGGHMRLDYDYHFLNIWSFYTYKFLWLFSLDFILFSIGCS